MLPSFSGLEARRGGGGGGAAASLESPSPLPAPRADRPRLPNLASRRWCPAAPRLLSPGGDRGWGNLKLSRAPAGGENLEREGADAAGSGGAEPQVAAQALARELCPLGAGAGRAGGSGPPLGPCQAHRSSPARHCQLLGPSPRVPARSTVLAAPCQHAAPAQPGVGGSQVWHRPLPSSLLQPRRPVSCFLCFEIFTKV